MIHGRLKWLDFAKGLVILFVIVGHTVHSSFRAVIFSFHMPFFFALSCITFRCSRNTTEFWKKTKKAFFHLIIPALIVFMVLTVLELYKSASQISVAYLWRFAKDRLLMLLYASGMRYETMGMKIPAIGMVWFLFALFIGRSLFDYLHMKLSGSMLFIACWVLSVIGVYFGYREWLPFSLDIVLAIMPFFWLGHALQSVDVEKQKLIRGSICALVWLVTFLPVYLISQTVMELAVRDYTAYPLCYLTAAAGTLAVVYLSVAAVRWGKWTEMICFLGRHSLYLLCIHSIDYLWAPLWKVQHRVGAPLLRTALTIVALFIFLGIGKMLLQKEKP